MVNKLGIGTVQFGLDYGISNKSGVTDLSEVTEILNCSRKFGIDTIDTAFGYGKSEEVLGKIGVSDFKIVTKFLSETPDCSIRDQIKLSLRRLKKDKLYGLMAHRPLDLLNKPELWDYLQSLKANRAVEKIGFSFNTTDEIDIILSKGFFPDIIQVPYNYFDNRFESYIIDLKSNGCEIHTRSPFLQGLFFTDTESLNYFFNPVKSIIRELQALNDDLPGKLLKYCLEKPFIDRVIFGINNKQQLVDNLESLTLSGYLPELKKYISNEILTPSEWPKA